MVRRGVVRRGVVRRGVVRRGAARRGVVWRGVVWRGAARPSRPTAARARYRGGPRAPSRASRLDTDHVRITAGLVRDDFDALAGILAEAAGGGLRGREPPTTDHPAAGTDVTGSDA
ncbi:hypothetical protein ABT297_15565 [Dactylosporangium sp. NPDC000555]|uniref:hypothetical protein n=1 Tax=Dactylosporangium sp. NPDC000555 TaxID=3154260 RepID=UPI003331E156